MAFCRIKPQKRDKCRLARLFILAHGLARFLRITFYIKNVISNLALYRMQLGEPAPELRELAAGGQGRFVSLFAPLMLDSSGGS